MYVGHRNSIHIPLLEEKSHPDWFCSRLILLFRYSLGTFDTLEIHIKA